MASACEVPWSTDSHDKQLSRPRVTGNLFEIGSRVEEESSSKHAVPIPARELRLEIALREVRRENEQLIGAARIRAEFSTMAIFIVLSFYFYSMLRAWMEKVARLDMSPRGPAALGISMGFLVVVLLLMLVYVRRHNLNTDHLGLRLGNWRRSILEGLSVSVAILPLLAVVKWLLVLHDPEFQGRRILNWSEWDPWLLLYAVVAPAQELVTRGFVQNAIERFLPTRRRSALAVVLTSAQFGVMHLHYSFRMAVIATAGSLLFGAMYVRQRTLVGPSIAHFILGALIIGPFQLMLD